MTRPPPFSGSGLAASASTTDCGAPHVVDRCETCRQVLRRVLVGHAVIWAGWAKPWNGETFDAWKAIKFPICSQACAHALRRAAPDVRVRFTAEDGTEVAMDPVPPSWESPPHPRAADQELDHEAYEDLVKAIRSLEARDARDAKRAAVWTCAGGRSTTGHRPNRAESGPAGRGLQGRPSAPLTGTLTAPVGKGGPDAPRP